jgi:glycosyltransferase involved in cell wall biosynthesis
VSQGLNFNGSHLAAACARLRVPFVLVAQAASELYWPEDADRAALRDGLRGARRVLFVSEHNRRLTEHQAGLRTIPRAEIVRNPLLAGRDGPLTWPQDVGETVRVACVARLDADAKGQDMLIEALAEPRWRERDVRLSFFGTGYHREGLAGLASRVGIEAVEFAGHAPRIEDVWRDHHLLALPSRMEGLPLALTEAMACGRVAVVTDVGGNAEVVEDGRSGFVAASPTAGAFGAALERAWQERARWPTIGANAAARVAELYPVAEVPRLAQIALDEAAGHAR